MKGRDFVFNYVYLLYYKCHKINPNCGGWHIHSPDWIKKTTKKQQEIPSIKKCFRCAVTAALNHEETKKDSQRITKIKPFLRKIALS